jgi:hypothetical protein
MCLFRLAAARKADPLASRTHLRGHGVAAAGYTRLSRSSYVFGIEYLGEAGPASLHACCSQEIRTSRLLAVELTMVRGHFESVFPKSSIPFSNFSLVMQFL